ncbi:hypothetical protein C2G38_2222319 [Gigaspora rosea]|uniref:Uncharacterized protein n=1 Tax=Gigaspora rosea TaxID=44941 RepID=A0A397U2P1_9GLOM|nr:hypothetical protein C2G38_2222319 [Gigaspora rosea]
MVDSLCIQPEIPNPSVPEISNPLETVDSLYKYDTEPEQAQKFLDKAEIFRMVTINAMGTFNEHKGSWSLIYNQEFKRFEPEYIGKKLDDLELEMPGAIYLLINKKRCEDLVKVAPARTVNIQRVGIKVKIQVKKLGKTDSVILDYNFHNPDENKMYKSVIDLGAPKNYSSLSNP